MSFYTSLNGMKNAQTSLGVIAHNISNSETYGFKRSRTEFSEIVAGSALTNPRMIQGIGASVKSITERPSQTIVFICLIYIIMVKIENKT